MSVIGRIHGSYVHSRRVRVLCDHLACFIPEQASVLDVGTGDGLLASLLLERRPDLTIEGVDVLPRPTSHIPVRFFDGRCLPCASKSFDVVLFVDVLHHTKDPMVLLREAVRVARRALVIKDHCRQGFAAGLTLRIMDIVGNARHGVSLPYNYWSRAQWKTAAESLQVRTEKMLTELKLYPSFADWIFGRSLHFLTQMSVPQPVQLASTPTTEEGIGVTPTVPLKEAA
jgi:SAM-dependent methyltransferase